MGVIKKRFLQVKSGFFSAWKHLIKFLLFLSSAQTSARWQNVDLMWFYCTTTNPVKAQLYSCCCSVTKTPVITLIRTSHTHLGLSGPYRITPPLLHLRLTAAGSHLYWAASLEAREGERQQENFLYACIPSSKSCPWCVFWPHTTGSEILCLITQQKNGGSSHRVIYVSA